MTKSYAARWRLYRPHEHPLSGVSVEPETSYRRIRLPIHHPLLGLSRSARNGILKEPPHDSADGGHAPTR